MNDFLHIFCVDNRGPRPSQQVWNGLFDRCIYIYIFYHSNHALQLKATFYRFILLYFRSTSIKGGGILIYSCTVWAWFELLYIKIKRRQFIDIFLTYKIWIESKTNLLQYMQQCMYKGFDTRYIDTLNLGKYIVQTRVTCFHFSLIM